MRNRTSDLRIPGSDALATEPQRLHGERGESHESRLMFSLFLMSSAAVNFLHSPPPFDSVSDNWSSLRLLETMSSPKISHPFSLKINNDRCGPLDTILRG